MLKKIWQLYQFRLFFLFCFAVYLIFKKIDLFVKVTHLKDTALKESMFTKIINRMQDIGDKDDYLQLHRKMTADKCTLTNRCSNCR